MEKIMNFRDKIGRAFNQLNETEQEIIMLRFGLNDGFLRTLQETADIMGVSRERIRQIEAKALQKIRQYDEHK